MRFLASSWGAFGVGVPLLLILAATTSLHHQAKGYPWGGDNALQIMHARNLVNGKSYTPTPYVYDDEAWMEGTPSFPPGLPAILAPVYRFTGLNLEQLRDFCILLLILSVIPFVALFRFFLPPWAAVGAAGLAIFNIFLLNTINNVGSESLYLLVSFSCLACATWVYANGKNETNPILWGSVVGVLATYTNFTRSIGIAMMFGIVLYDLFRNRRITRFLIAAGSVFFLAIVASNIFLHSDATYRTQFRLDPVLTLTNAKMYAVSSLEIWTGMPGQRWPRVILAAVTGGLVLWGLVTRCRRHGLGLLEFYALGYFGVLSVYWIANGRYLTPLVPLYFLYLFEGLRLLWQWNRLRWVAATVVLLMVYSEVTRLQPLGREPLADGVHTATYREAIAYIREKITPTARIASDSARFLALLTERPSTSYPWQESPVEISRFLERLRVDYVLVSKHHELDQQKLIPALALRANNAKPVFENAEYALYPLN